MGLLVPDWKNSETGRQRRKATNGRLLHCCCICGKLETWGRDWEYYGSYKDEEDGIALPKFCSPGCRSKGGVKACHASEEMRESARAAEWREPTIAYREATEREKFRYALDLQKRS